jgi:hypothetical protein
MKNGNQMLRFAGSKPTAFKWAAEAYEWSAGSKSVTSCSTRSTSRHATMRRALSALR